MQLSSDTSALPSSSVSEPPTTCTPYVFHPSPSTLPHASFFSHIQTRPANQDASRPVYIPSSSPDPDEIDICQASTDLVSAYAAQPFEQGVEQQVVARVSSRGETSDEERLPAGEPAFQDGYIARAEGSFDWTEDLDDGGTKYEGESPSNNVCCSFRCPPNRLHELLIGRMLSAVLGTSVQLQSLAIRE